MNKQKNQSYLSEVFSSIQGEGLYVGDRHLFVRFAGCNLNCQYCDTPDSRAVGNKPTATSDLLETIKSMMKNKKLHSAITHLSI